MKKHLSDLIHMPVIVENVRCPAHAMFCPPCLLAYPQVLFHFGPVSSSSADSPQFHALLACSLDCVYKKESSLTRALTSYILDSCILQIGTDTNPTGAMWLAIKMCQPFISAWLAVGLQANYHCNSYSRVVLRVYVVRVQGAASTAAAAAALIG